MLLYSRSNSNYSLRILKRVKKSVRMSTVPVRTRAYICDLCALQIYNEQVRDLFGQGDSGGHGLRVREHPIRGAFVEGLSARPVTCYQQVQRLLEDGMSARSVTDWHLR